jgi:hypothetical protein
MTVLGGRAGENPQDFHEGRGVQVPLLAFCLGVHEKAVWSEHIDTPVVVGHREW